MPDSYTMLSAAQNADRRLAWLREAYQEGDALLKAQRNYKDIASAIGMIAGEEKETIPAALSQVHTNRLKRQVREVVAVMSQINASWFWESIDGDYSEVATVLNKIHRGWWFTTSADRKIREWVQYAAALGTGYIGPKWIKPGARYGKGEIDLEAYGPGSVRFVQPPKDYNIQKSYMTIISEETPVNRARSIYPQHADKLVPNRGMASWGGKSKAMDLIRKIGGSPILQKFGYGKSDREREGDYPTVDIHRAYILDNTMNPSKQPIYMGEQGTSWHYKVPFYGESIPTNVPPYTRPAQAEDCLLYPLRRLVVWTDTVLLYDGPAPDWHGMTPLVRLRLDDWPWAMLGYGLLRDGWPIQKEINAVLRGIGDRHLLGLNPGLIYDKDAVSQNDMNRLDPRIPGARLRVNMKVAQDPIRPMLPPEMLKVGPELMQYVEFLGQEMDHQMAIADLRSMAKAKQLPSDQTIQKMIEIAGPLVQDMTGNMEAGMRDLGQMIGAGFFQYYNAARRVKMIGMDGLSLETFQYDPEMLVPKSVEPFAKPQQSWEKNQRMRDFMGGFQLMVTPHSLHEILQTQNKLMHLQLWRDPQFPLSPYTLAEVFGIRNFGKPPDDAQTEMDKWKAWMKTQQEFQVLLQAHAALLMAKTGMGGMMGGGDMGGGGGGGAPQGRPPSGQSAPKLESKDGGARQTVTES